MSKAAKPCWQDIRSLPETGLLNGVTGIKRSYLFSKKPGLFVVGFPTQFIISNMFFTVPQALFLPEVFYNSDC